MNTLERLQKHVAALAERDTVAKRQTALESIVVKDGAEPQAGLPISRPREIADQPETRTEARAAASQERVGQITARDRAEPDVPANLPHASPSPQDTRQVPDPPNLTAPEKVQQLAAKDAAQAPGEAAGSVSPAQAMNEPGPAIGASEEREPDAAGSVSPAQATQPQQEERQYKGRWVNDRPWSERHPVAALGLHQLIPGLHKTVDKVRDTFGMDEKVWQPHQDDSRDMPEGAPQKKNGIGAREEDAFAGRQGQRGSPDGDMQALADALKRLTKVVEEVRDVLQQGQRQGVQNGAFPAAGPRPLAGQNAPPDKQDKGQRLAAVAMNMLKGIL